MRKIISIIIVIIMGILTQSNYVESLELTTFNNSLSSENLTFTNTDLEDIRYFKIYNNSNIFYSTLNLSGFNHTGIDEVQNLTVVCEQEYYNFSNASFSSSVGDVQLNAGLCGGAGSWDSLVLLPQSTISGTKGMGTSFSSFADAEAIDCANQTYTSSSSINFQSTGGVIQNRVICTQTQGGYFGKFYLNGSIESDGNNTKVTFWFYNKSSFPNNVNIDTANDSGSDFINTTVFNTTRNININITAIQNYLVTCTLDSSKYCHVPIKFNSTTVGKLQVSDINITYYITPNITQNSQNNFTQTLAINQNITFTLNVAHDIAENVTYNFTANNNRNFTVGFSQIQLNTTNTDTSSSNITISVNSTSSLSNHSFNITATRIEDNKAFNFTVYITTSNNSAILSWNTTNWVQTGDSSQTFTRAFQVNNTGNYNASRCTFNINKGGGTGNLNSFMSVNDSNFFIENGTSNDIEVNIIQPTAATYSNEFLEIYCNGTSDNNLVYSSQDVELTFTISSPSSSSSGGGGGSSVTTTIIQQVKDGNITGIVDWGKPSHYITIYSIPNTPSGSFVIANIGNNKIVANLSITEYLGKVVTYRICDLDKQSCNSLGQSTTIEVGETKLLLFETNIKEDFEIIQGQFILKDSENDKIHSLDVTVDKPLGFPIIQFIFELSGGRVSGTTIAFILFIMTMILGYSLGSVLL